MPSIIEGYNYDIFISYRQKDNKGDRWVSEFVEALKTELESTFKEEISVYFDINPHDGLLETHDVNASLKEKLKCLIFIPIISRTYCDPKSFAWEHEFKAFVELASKDRFGLKVKLPNGNVASRVLPVQIHGLDVEDKKLCEEVFGGFMRGIEFIYKEPGVNRPLRFNEENPHDNLNHTIYRNQINKVTLAIKEVINSLLLLDGISKKAEETEHIPITILGEKTHIDAKIHSRKRKINKVFSAKSKTLYKINLAKIYKTSLIILVTGIIIIAGITITKLIYNQKKRSYARNVLIPEIQKLVDENFTPPCSAFNLAIEAGKYLHDDSLLLKLWPKISAEYSLHTKPERAKLFWKDYTRPQDPWKLVGITPLENFRLPLAYKRIKIEKEGFETIVLTSLSLLGLGTKESVRLDSTGTLPQNMVRVLSRIAPRSNMGRVKYAGKMVGEFLADRCEVTNKEYKQFLDAGGYSTKSFWKYPFYKDMEEISWDSAMKIFIDKAGKPGPAGWEVGSYPSGEGNYPVTGVSWYEAAAYAEFCGKSLPTVYHWSVIAETANGMYIIPFSNLNGKSIVPVGSMEGMSSYGIYDLAGNAREWCFNGNGIKGEHYNVGGGWNDPLYSFHGAGTQPGLDRSPSNGFRCIKVLPGDSTINNLIGSINQPQTEYYKEKPVDDKIFNILIRQYDYDKTPLNDEVTYTADSVYWKIERVSLDAAYNNERFDVYLFIPKSIKPPFQPVIYFPGSNVIYLNKFSNSYLTTSDFIVKSGRVLIWPVLKGTFERKDELNSDLQEETVFYRDHVIMWRKDISRTIDYLETRNDILIDKLGYYGVSWGGFMGGLIPAVEKRIRVVVLHVGGIDRNKALPEADQINFLPRVLQPVLMLNGKYDMYFPEETSQKPMFNLLGTPQNDKKIIIYETGHRVPRSDLIKETLAWYDKYLGPIN